MASHSVDFRAASGFVDASGFDVQALAYALLVIEFGSFRRAASGLHVRPSVVSRRIRALEDTLGVSLFNRTSRGIQPTTAGDRVLKRGRLILAEIDLLRRTAALNGRGEEGRLRLGIVASIASGFARELLLRFREAHPDLELEVIEGSPRDNVASVRALALDFAIVTGMPLSPGCEVETLWHERVAIALRDDHPLAVQLEIAWEELAHERFIVSRVDPGPEIQDYIVRGLAELGRHPDVEQVAVQRETLLALVGLGQGLSLVGEAEAGVTYPGVTFRPLDHEEIPFSIVWSEKNDNPAFRRFLSSARVQAAERRRPQ